MATLEQEKKQLEVLQNVLGTLAGIKPESLVRADVLGVALSFQEALPIFQRTLELYRNLSECDLTGVSYSKLKELFDNANAVNGIVQRILAFSVDQNQQNPMQARTQLINEFRDRYDADYQSVVPQLAYAERRGMDFAALEREARGTLVLQQKLSTESKAASERMLVDMGEALQKVRQAAAEAGVSQHAIHLRTRRFSIRGSLDTGLARQL